jgi:methylmalonyl-CoA mutase cobalamin-binding domain/chain
MLEKLRESFINLDEQSVIDTCKKCLDRFVKPTEILQTLKDGMEEIGEKFEKGDYFLSELVMAGEIMKKALAILNPYLTIENARACAKGKIVLGTILGDLHDIGKDIAKTFLLSTGFEVYDLGIDVPPIEFVRKAKEVRADVIGISALLSVTVPLSKDVVELLKREGIREKVKVIVGGAATRKEHEKIYGLDAVVNDAIEGVKIIKSWMENYHEAEKQSFNNLRT